MLAASIAAILARDLRALSREIEAYPDDELPWRVPPGIANSGGNLVLHLCGNLQYLVGAQLGATGFVRDRDAEFTQRAVARQELVARVQATSAVVERTLAGVIGERLAEDFPLVLNGRRVRTDDFLVHLATHLAYHLGQVDYHRRLVCGGGGPVGAMLVAELASARAVPA